MDILLITTPPQHSTSNQAVIQKSKALKEWIATLPVMNVIETVALLQNAVKPFNELQMDATERLKLLEIYHEAFEEILYSYDELRLRTLPISPEERKAISEDIMWLYLGLATGYKIIVKEGHASGLSPKRDVALLFSICRAMELILNAVVYAYKVHEQPPPLAFLEIKQLYQFVKRHDVEDVRIKNIKGHAIPPTISNLFKHFMLLNLVDPAKFDANDIPELFMLLEGFAPLCTYVEKSSQRADSDVYVVNLEDDEPAKKADEKNIALDIQNQIFLDIRPALDAIKDKLQQADGTTQSLIEKNEGQLLSKFLGQDTSSSNAGIRKPGTSKPYKLVASFNAILKILNHKDQLTAIFDVEVIDGIEVSNLDEDIATALSDWKLSEEKAVYRVLVGQQPAGDTLLHTGDIVGLIESPEGANFAPLFLVGVIRKIKELASGDIKLGLEIIPGQAIPFTFTTSTDALAEGIYFTAITALGRPASLLCRQSDIKDMQSLQATMNNQTHQIKIDAILLQTQTYIQYSYKIMT